MNHYEALGVDSNADTDAIKAAFRRLASEHHPDRGGDTDQMALINKAHETLIDVDARKRYDETGEDTPEKPLEAAARDLLLHVFSMVLNETWDHDMVGKARSTLDSALVQINAETMKVKNEIERVTKRRKKVRSKGVRNLFNDICLQRIGDLNEKLPGLARHQAVHEAARKMLDDYECDVEVPPSLTALFTVGGGTQAYHSGGTAS